MILEAENAPQSTRRTTFTRIDTNPCLAGLCVASGCGCDLDLYEHWSLSVTRAGAS